MKINRSSSRWGARTYSVWRGGSSVGGACKTLLGGCFHRVALACLGAFGPKRSTCVWRCAQGCARGQRAAALAAHKWPRRVARAFLVLDLPSFQLARAHRFCSSTLYLSCVVLARHAHQHPALPCSCRPHVGVLATQLVAEHGLRPRWGQEGFVPLLQVVRLPATGWRAQIVAWARPARWGFRVSPPGVLNCNRQRAACGGSPRWSRVSMGKRNA